RCSPRRIKIGRSGGFSLGAALSVRVACMHYWGIAALFGMVWFGLVLIYERRSSPDTLIRPTAAMAAGVLVIGAPYLVLFVIPRLPAILAMVSGVQNPGGRTIGGPAAGALAGRPNDCHCRSGSSLVRPVVQPRKAGGVHRLSDAGDDPLFRGPAV